MIESNLLKETHELNKSWGSSKDIPLMAEEAIKKYNIKSLLDFGSGKGFVSKAIREKYDIDVTSFEPSINNRSELPEQVEMVFSKDVLEHVEPDQLEFTLYDLHRRK